MRGEPIAVTFPPRVPSPALRATSPAGRGEILSPLPLGEGRVRGDPIDVTFPQRVPSPALRATSPAGRGEILSPLPLGEG